MKNLLKPIYILDCENTIELYFDLAAGNKEAINRCIRAIESVNYSDYFDTTDIETFLDTYSE